MKYVKQVLFFLMVVPFLATAQQNQNQIPSKILEFVSTHYPDAQVVKYKLDKDWNSVEHEVRLSDMTELEFDENYGIKSIESEQAIPSALIPKVIQNYVAANYSNQPILEWEKKHKGQKIELANDLELYFDHQGKFIREDR